MRRSGWSLTASIFSCQVVRFPKGGGRRKGFETKQKVGVLFGKQSLLLQQRNTNLCQRKQDSFGRTNSSTQFSEKMSTHGFSKTFIRGFRCLKSGQSNPKQPSKLWRSPNSQGKEHLSSFCAAHMFHSFWINMKNVLHGIPNELDMTEKSLFRPQNEAKGQHSAQRTRSDRLSNEIIDINISKFCIIILRNRGGKLSWDGGKMAVWHRDILFSRTWTHPLSRTGGEKTKLASRWWVTLADEPRRLGVNWDLKGDVILHPYRLFFV